MLNWWEGIEKKLLARHLLSSQTDTFSFIHSFFFQIYGNDNTQCPDKSGGRNVSRLYIDSSEPSDGGTGIWTQDESLSFECYDNGYKTVKCKCKSYKVFNLVNGNRYVYYPFF